MYSKSDRPIFLLSMDGRGRYDRTIHSFIQNQAQDSRTEKEERQQGSKSGPDSWSGLTSTENFNAGTMHKYPCGEALVMR